MTRRRSPWMLQRIGGDVGRELARFGPAAGMADLVSAWPAAVGESIARNAWPARLARDGTLHVNTASSTWAFELGQLAPTILERLRAAAGESAPPALRFAVGRLPEASPEAERASPRRPPAPSQADRERAAAIAASVDDEELRALIARAAAASLARAASDRGFW